MKNTKVPLRIVTPVLIGFFAMSFCDLVGIGVDRVKLDFELSNSLAQLIPSAVFLWFFVLSVPVGILQDRWGKKKMLILGLLITILGLLIPYLFYSFKMVLAGFALLGIGNTVVQVSANPLLVDTVPSSRRSSFLSFSQFIKAIGSMVAAPLAGLLASKFGDWRLMFPVFALISILTALWLGLTPIEETKNQEERASLKSSFKLLGNSFITLMVLCIILVVGIDVGVNSISGQFLIEKFNMEQIHAESGRSLYFFGKMLGTFVGAILLVKISSRKFFIASSIVGLFSILALVFAPTEFIALALIFIIGLGVANIFPLVFSIAIGRYPNRSNEISGLMVMAIAGGAILPPLMGWISDALSVSASIFVLVAAIGFILLVSLMQKKTDEADIQA